MRLAALFSGGKDSTYAMYLASKQHAVVCLVNILPVGEDSWMFHVPNARLTAIQAKALELPIVQVETRGEKEKELEDLKKALREAKKSYEIEGVVTGAIRSVYQFTRIQKVCDELGLKCFNPLWQKDEIELLKGFVLSGFKAIVVGVFSFPFDESWLGREIDESFIRDISALKQKYGLSAVGEGGEFETFVYDGPLFRKKIKIVKTEKRYQNYRGVLEIKEVELIEKT